MSWQDKIDQVFSITTGDGQLFTPLWDPHQSVVLIQKFMLAEFNFRGLRGTLVDRGEVMGNLYDIEVVFQGTDHLTEATNFRTAARNKKPWKISHPYYGNIICHPSELRYNNSDGNITRITGQILETIDATTVSTSLSQVDKIAIDKLNTDSALYSRYIADVPAPKITDLQGMTANVKAVDKRYTVLIKASEVYNAFKNGVSAVNDAISRATEFPGNAIASMQSIISAPANFVDSEVNRLLMLVSAFEDLYNYTADMLRSTKILYENNAGTIISTICLVSVTNIGTDYDNSTAVLSVIGTITDTYSQYLNNLDQMQTLDGAHPDSYVPDPASLDKITSLVNYTISQLLQIAANAKQKNTYILPEDFDISTLAYQLYGSASDDYIDQLFANNSLTFRDILILKKGREIVYYV